MNMMPKISTLDETTVGNLSFKRRDYGHRPEITAYTTGAKGLTLHLSVGVSHDGDTCFGTVSHWLADNDTKDPSGFTPIMQFHVDQVPDAAGFEETLAAIRFEAKTIFGTEWIVSSTGHAAAIDSAGEVIMVSPGDSGKWNWKRGCHALDQFWKDTQSFIRLENIGLPSQEAAMREALASKAVLGAALTKLATSFGLNVVS